MYILQTHAIYKHNKHKNEKNVGQAFLPTLYSADGFREKCGACSILVVIWTNLEKHLHIALIYFHLPAKKIEENEKNKHNYKNEKKHKINR